MFLIKTQSGILQLHNAGRIDVFSHKVNDTHNVFLDVDAVRIKIFSCEDAADCHEFVAEFERAIVAGLTTTSSKLHSLPRIIQSVLDSILAKEVQ